MTSSGNRLTVRCVNRAAAIKLLPQAYAVALRLRDAGLRPAEIARRLGIAPEAVDSTLELAEAKLARLLGVEDSRAEPPARDSVVG
jgi:DNA-directed RNA polymerase specialized sigma24 family protein